MRGRITGDIGTGRGCGKMIDVESVGVGGTGTTQLKGFRTSKTPGVPASAAFAAFVGQWIVSVVVLPYGNTETGESRHLYRVPRRAVGLQVPMPVSVRACAGNTDEVDQNRTCASNRPQRSTVGYIDVVCTENE